MSGHTLTSRNNPNSQERVKGLLECLEAPPYLAYTEVLV